jgi:retron-type reverse transcriptase
MKTLLERVRAIETLGRAWRAILENGRSSRSILTRREIEEFARTSESRLTRIQRQLNRGCFKFGPAIGVPARKKGKNEIRPLVIAPIESRIVQRAIHDVLLRVPSITHYVENPFSFGGVGKKPGNDLGAVPAAIQAALDAIRGGATWVVRSDISSFFTKIPKPTVTQIVAEATNDPEFVEFFGRAIVVELKNLASLRCHASAFPIHEIGVAQGNSLSPLLGNLFLRDFDREMNAGICRCIRYIDDFLILAPDRATADLEFSRALSLLAKYNLEVSAKKTFRGDCRRGFVFLGIELGNGAIRPSKESRRRLLTNISKILNEGAHALRSHRKTGNVDRSFSLIRTLTEVGGLVQGWGSHYSFCNEKNIFGQLDQRLNEMLREYLGCYSGEIKRTDEKGRRHLLGVPLLEELAFRPFSWSEPSTTESVVPLLAASGA